MNPNRPNGTYGNVKMYAISLVSRLSLCTLFYCMNYEFTTAVRKTGSYRLPHHDIMGESIWQCVQSGLQYFIVILELFPVGLYTRTYTINTTPRAECLVAMCASHSLGQVPRLRLVWRQTRLELAIS